MGVVEGRDMEVCHHHHLGIATEEFPVGIEFHLFQFGAAFADSGQSQMGVRFRVAVTREVLDTARDAAILHSLEVEGGLGHHLVAVLAEGAAVDDGVTGVVVDIDAGGEVKVDAVSNALAGHLEAHLVDERVVESGEGAERHLAGEGRAAVKTHCGAPLSVDGDKQGHLAQLLHPVGEDRLAHGPALEKADAAGLVALDGGQHISRLLRRARGADTHNHQLRNLLLQGHLRQCLRRPLRTQGTCCHEQQDEQAQYGPDYSLQAHSRRITRDCPQVRKSSRRQAHRGRSR